MRWFDAQALQLKNGTAHVLITVIEVQGSAPRAVGSKMVVTAKGIFDSIGGGNLEYQAIAQARRYLKNDTQLIEQQCYTLGNDLAQCCGGRVTLLFELFVTPALNIVLFGAGHVGKAVAQILSQVDCRLNWYDQRAECFDDSLAHGNIQTHVYSSPHLAVEACESSSSYLIMTHSHDTDFELVEAVLSRDDVAYVGLIASASKAAKFRNRLRRKGFSEQEICRLIAPVGTSVSRHKEPMAVAVAIVAQLLELDTSAHQSSVNSHYATDRIQ